MPVKTILDGSTLALNDAVVSFCDPQHLPKQYGESDKIALIKRFFTYALYTDHIVVANRYFREGGILLDTLRQIPEFLQEGIIVPDIQEKYESFSQYGDWYKRTYGIDISEAMEFVDDNASTVFSFCGEEQGKRYKRHLMEDLNKGGFYYEALAQGDAKKKEQFIALAEYIPTIQGDTRRGFVEYASQILPEHRRDWEALAAARYCMVPAEMQRPCIREFPRIIVGRINGFHPSFNEMGEVEFSLSNSVNRLSSEVFCEIGNLRSESDIKAMSQAILKVRSEEKDLRELTSSLAMKDYSSGICADVSRKLLDEFKKQSNRGLSDEWYKGLISRIIICLSAHLFADDFMLDLLASECAHQIFRELDKRQKPILLACTELTRAYKHALERNSRWTHPAGSFSGGQH